MKQFIFRMLSLSILKLFLLSSFLIPTSYAEGRQSGAELAQLKGCNKCHGVDGISSDPFTPNLAGQKFKYLKKQTDMFKSNEARTFQGELISSRSHPRMDKQLEPLTPSVVNRIIYHYSKLSCRVEPSRKIIAIIPKAKQCEACHGGLRTSPFRDSPNLAGQKQKYMLRQLQHMVKLTTSDKAGNTRYHRLSGLMTDGLTQKDLYQITRYYADMGCS